MLPKKTPNRKAQGLILGRGAAPQTMRQEPRLRVGAGSGVGVGLLNKGIPYI